MGWEGKGEIRKIQNYAGQLPPSPLGLPVVNYEHYECQSNID